MKLPYSHSSHSDEPLTRDNLASVSVDRQTARFGPVLQLAKLLLSRSVPDLRGNQRTFSLLFDMNVVFERYIGNLLKQVICPPRLTAQLQVQGRSLLLQDGRPRFRLKPDVAIYQREELLCLIDTKWKVLYPNRPHHGINQNDIYQIYAYGKEYSCPLAIVLYPQTAGFPWHVASYCHNPGGIGSERIEVCAVDIRKQPTGLGLSQSVSHQLDQILNCLLPQERILLPTPRAG